MKRKISLLLLIFAFGTIAAVALKTLDQKHSENEFLILNWSYRPQEIKPNEPVEFRIRLKDRTGPIENAVVTLEGFRQKTEVQKASTLAGPQGVYKGNMIFPESGEWTVVVTIQKEEGASMKRDFRISINSLRKHL